MSRELAHDLLEDAGYLVEAVGTVDDARRAVDRSAPQVVLLDWHLKGATGADVLHHVRASAQARDVPILVVTADIRPDLRVAALAAGADGVVTKPYRSSDLVAAVAAAIARDDEGRR